MLTEAQRLDVRRHAGYPLLADVVANDTTDPVTAWVAPGAYHTLTRRLNNLTAAEEAILTGTYLTVLTTLEAAIPTAGDNLDTDQAAVWHRNRDEVRDRQRLFDDWRRRMCGFLGIPPGPALGASGVMGAVVRA